MFLILCVAIDGFLTVLYTGKKETNKSTILLEVLKILKIRRPKISRRLLVKRSLLSFLSF